MPYKIMIVDDSRVFRKALTSIINKNPALEVVCVADNGQDMLEKLEAVKPDMITLDLDMPVMDGISALPIIVKKYNIPVLIVSSLSKQGADITIRALSLGAADFITKPLTTSSLDTIEDDLVQKINALLTIPRTSDFARTFMFPSGPKAKKDYYPVIDETSAIIVIGTSTGGPSAIPRIIETLSADLNATFLIVLHMPEFFTRAFADRMNTLTELHFKEAEDGDVLRRGAVLLAKGNHHLVLEQTKKGVIARVSAGTKFNGHIPSVEMLFASAAKLKVSNRIFGVLLTGMGADGVDGLGAIQKMGGTTIAQDEQSCVVFGMPKAAIDKGYAQHVSGIDQMTALIKKLVNSKGRKD